MRVTSPPGAKRPPEKAPRAPRHGRRGTRAGSGSLAAPTHTHTHTHTHRHTHTLSLSLSLSLFLSLSLSLFLSVRRCALSLLSARWWLACSGRLRCMSCFRRERSMGCDAMYRIQVPGWPTASFAWRRLVRGVRLMSPLACAVFTDTPQPTPPAVLSGLRCRPPSRYRLQAKFDIQKSPTSLPSRADSRVTGRGLPRGVGRRAASDVPPRGRAPRRTATAARVRPAWVAAVFALT